jgi:hypothetical protein
MSSSTFHTDTSDMIAVHTVFRSAFDVAPELVGKVQPDDEDRATLVSSFYRNVLAFLRVHQEGEDRLLWSKLLERCPRKTRLIRHAAAQHRRVDKAAGAAEAKLADWAAVPSPDRGNQLGDALTALGEELINHLNDEETNLLPLASRYISPAEWAELPAHEVDHFEGDKLWLLLGLTMENLAPARRDDVLAHLPLRTRNFWLNSGRPRFTSFIAEVRA